MLNLPENIKDLVPVTSPISDIETALQLPIEENSILDYFADTDILQ